MQVNLSDSEWKLMNRLWEQSPRTIMELTASLKEDTGWSKNTVITMLARLEAKGAVRHEEGGRAKRYFPAVDREDAAAAETESFLSRVYGGSLGLMMSAMVESRQLTEADIASWLDLLDHLDPDGRTSMCQDIMAGRRTEKELFSGTIRRLAAEHGISVPVNDFLYEKLQELEEGMK